ncbi:hypothetical protein CYMTET_24210, partial [Cymbomonas tetramitiformis]
CQQVSGKQAEESASHSLTRVPGVKGCQAALNEHAFEVLKQRMGVVFECFASPLNCHYEGYCSAFQDVDGPFGSRGNFFQLKGDSLEGSFEANPPFVSSVMSAMAIKMHALLKAATKRGTALSFVVVVPGWTDEPSWAIMQKSEFRRALWQVAREDHGFCDGAQHQRRDRFRASPFDTAVFVLQTAAGAAKWRATSKVERELRAAMAQAVPTPAVAQRRMKDGRGMGDLDGAGGVYKGKRKCQKNAGSESQELGAHRGHKRSKKAAACDTHEAQERSAIKARPPLATSFP